MGAVSAFASEYTVSSAAEIRALRLQAGDTVVWKNGVYPSNEGFDLLGEGSATQPIILRAETPGGVVFTGPAEVNIGGTYLILEGFHWKGGPGVSNHLEFRKGGSATELAINCIVRNCAFEGLQSQGDAKSRWVVFYGSSNTLENCSFLHKNSTGACVLVELSYLKGARAGHHIRNNYFYDIPDKAGRSDDGDCEAIRVGAAINDSDHAGVTVIGNYFVEANGEAEIISDKSNHNRYLQNTFRRCQGALVMRSGSDAWVEGNYFLGEGGEHTGGIRISGINHTIINNYLDSLQGTGNRAAIAIVGGNHVFGTPGGAGAYAYVENLNLHFNTIYNCRQSLLFKTSNHRPRPDHPLSGHVSNNLICRYEPGSYALIHAETAEHFSPGLFRWENNLMFAQDEASSGYSAEGIAFEDPQMQRVDGLARPDSRGVAANSASDAFRDLQTDVEGQRRDGRRDIGADEVSGATSPAPPQGPITDAQVGNGVGCSFIAAP